MKKLIILLPLLMAMSRQDIQLGTCLVSNKDYGSEPEFIEKIIGIGKDGFTTTIVATYDRVIPTGMGKWTYDYSDLPKVKRWPCPKGDRR